MPANNTQEPEERDFFCRIRDSFRHFARKSSAVLGTAWAFIGALIIIAVWGLTGPVFHYSDTWQLIINTGTTIVTFLMVFVIQASQNRDSKALHLKLDEVIRAIEGARNEFITTEESTEAQLREREAELDEIAHNGHDHLRKPRRTSPSRAPR